MSTFHRILTGSALVLLVACGGGGGGNPPTPTPAPVISGISPTSGPAGTTVTISGSNLNGATAVSFNGTPAASFSAAASAISAVVPSAATAGAVSVTTPGGTTTSGSATFTRTAGTLAYTDPTSGTYKLVRNAGLSSATHLVLDLLGPAGTSGRGVGFYLSADTTRVTWAKVASSDAELVQNAAFNVGTGQQLLKAKVAGDVFQAGVYQKGSAVPAVAFTTSGALARVALDLKGNPALGTITFQPVTNKAVLLPDAGPATTIVISVGTLTAQ